MLRAPLPQDKVIAAWSQIADGNMMWRLGEPAEVSTARTTFLGKLGLAPADCARLAVTKGTADRIKVVGRELAGVGMDAGEPPQYCDAFITDQPGLALWLLIADCVPVMFFDPATPRIALAHCGRVSTDLRLAAQVVASLRDLGSYPQDLQVVLGPAIKAESYIYDDNIYQKSGPEWKPYLTQLGPNRVAIDLFAYNRQQLLDAGVPEKNIHMSPVNTAADPAWFSHVRSVNTGEPEGRFAAVIALPKNQ